MGECHAKTSPSSYPRESKVTSEPTMSKLRTIRARLLAGFVLVTLLPGVYLRNPERHDGVDSHGGIQNGDRDDA